MRRVIIIADVNTLPLITFANQNGDTALHRAAKYGHVDILHMLLEEQASIDEMNDVRYSYNNGVCAVTRLYIEYNYNA